MYTVDLILGYWWLTFIVSLLSLHTCTDTPFWKLMLTSALTGWAIWPFAVFYCVRKGSKDETLS